MRPPIAYPVFSTSSSGRLPGLSLGALRRSAIAVLVAMSCAAHAQVPGMGTDAATSGDHPATETTPVAPAETTNEAPGVGESDKAASKVEDKALASENSALTGQILYQFLLGEIAAQRGQFPLAASVYQELAKNTQDARLARRAAEMAFHARQYEPALEMVRLWLKLEPDSVQARQMESALLLATNRVEELSGALSIQLEQSGSKVGEVLVQLARAFARHPQQAAVQRLFDRLTEPYLFVPEARLVRTQLAFRMKDNERALTEINAALTLRPAWELAALYKADLMAPGADKLAFLQSFVEANPDAKDARLAYARALVGEKRYEAARAEFRKLLENHPDNYEILYAVGILALQLNDVNEAEVRLKHFVEQGHGELDVARFYLGQIADQAGRDDEAVKWYDHVEKGENAVPARIRAAQVLLRQKKTDEARERISAARRLEPKDARILVSEAQLLRDAGRGKEAYELLATALETQPEQPDLLYESALAAEKIGKLDVMERNLRHLIKLKPDSPLAYNALGYSLADRNIRLKEAEELIDKALSLAPDDMFILDSKGWVLFRLGNSEEALKMLKRASAQRPDPEIAAHIGEVLWSLGRRDEALDVMRDAAKRHPDNEVLSATMKRLSP